MNCTFIFLTQVCERTGRADQDGGHQAWQADSRADAGRGHQSAGHQTIHCPTDGMNELLAVILA